MACHFVCDACGKQEPARPMKKQMGQKEYWWWEKPEGWLQRADDSHDVCGPECALKINEKTGLHAPIEGKNAGIN